MDKIRKKTFPDMKAKKNLVYFISHYQNSGRNTDTKMSNDSFETLTDRKQVGVSNKIWT
jgi:hypothetical protein